MGLGPGGFDRLARNQLVVPVNLRVRERAQRDSAETRGSAERSEVARDPKGLAQLTGLPVPAARTDTTSNLSWCPSLLPQDKRFRDFDCVDPLRRRTKVAGLRLDLDQAVLTQAFDQDMDRLPGEAEALAEILLGGDTPARDGASCVRELVDAIDEAIFGDRNIELLAYRIEDKRVPRFVRSLDFPSCALTLAACFLTARRLVRFSPRHMALRIIRALPRSASVLPRA